MPQTRSLVFGSLFVGGLLVIAWLEYYPASPMLEVIGVPGPRANSGLQCGGFYRQTVVGRVRTRDMVCRATRNGDPMNSQEVSMDALNRRIVNARRIWTAPDSGEWKKKRDSVATALTLRGGHEFVCETNNLGGPITFRETGFWRFPKFYARLVASTWEETPSQRRWVIQVDGYPTLPPECVKNAGKGFSREQFCTADAVIRMPLPGNRTLCVKTNFWP